MAVEVAGWQPKGTLKDESVTIKCDVYWAALNQPNKKSKKFQVDLSHLSDDAVKKLESLNIPVKTCDKDEHNRGRYITCKSTYPIKAFDTSKVQIIDEVGNGSKAIAKIEPRPWTYDGDTGVLASLQTLVITDLIKYDDGEDFDLEQFVAEAF